ncbi:MAG: hypothetical protein ACR2NT_00795 [Acidimicrobiia bacterium]|nr:hypothetical protein [Acidimicrobiia bacterium]MDQ3500631.1 hypothetical protein [Actinomycetota bacterium]
MNSERGSTPIELALGLMMIVVPVAIVILLVAPIFEARNFARRAAAEGARAGVVAIENPLDAASSAITRLATGLGVPPESVTVEFCEGATCSWARGATFVVDVSVQVDQVSDLLPTGSMTVSARHGEQIDLYRSLP